MPIRIGFIERLDPADPADPPLALLIRGGQGGGVRLKLLISLIWFSVTFPHKTEYPARSWAALLGLPQHETNGARRISAALTWLEEAGLVRVDGRAGAPNLVTLLDERGNRAPYRLPYDAWSEKTEAGDEITREDLWVTLPPELWTKGWITILSAPALAMLLVMTEEAKYARRIVGLWHSPTQADRRFALSQDTRKVGLAELTRYGILDKRTQPVSPGVFDKKRRRNIYDLHLEQLKVFPGEPRPEQVEESLALAPESAGAEDDRRRDDGTAVLGA